MNATGKTTRQHGDGREHEGATHHDVIQEQGCGLLGVVKAMFNPYPFNQALYFSMLTRPPGAAVRRVVNRPAHASLLSRSLVWQGESDKAMANMPPSR
jgi:hypothetical protein